MRRLEFRRLLRHEQGMLLELAGYDREAFGEVGLRQCDLAVLLEAGAIYLALVGDEIAGSCQVMRAFDDPAVFYLVGLYVRSPWRGKGIGKEMLLKLLSEIAGMGATVLTLTVAPANEAGLNLYLSLGCEVKDTVRDFYGPGEDRHLLHCVLRAPNGGKQCGADP